MYTCVLTTHESFARGTDIGPEIAHRYPIYSLLFMTHIYIYTHTITHIHIFIHLYDLHVLVYTFAYIYVYIFIYMICKTSRYFISFLWLVTMTYCTAIRLCVCRDLKHTSLLFVSLDSVSYSCHLTAPYFCGRIFIYIFIYTYRKKERDMHKKM